MLEKLEQYLQYDIEPPVNLAKMHARWTVLMQEKRKEREAVKSEKINEVSSIVLFFCSAHYEVMLIWKRRVEWWNEDKTSAESAERYHIHCAEYGKGVDFTSQVLSIFDLWIPWLGVISRLVISLVSFDLLSRNSGRTG